MKYIALTNLFSIFCYLLTYGQYEQKFYDSTFVLKYKIKSVKEYIEVFTYKNDQLNEKENIDTLNGPILNMILEFDKNGHIVKRYYREDDFENLSYSGGQIELTEDVLDKQNRIIERKYFFNEKYKYSEFYEYNKNGQKTVTKVNYNDKILLKDSTIYDTRGNIIEVINGTDGYSNCNSANRWTKKYNANNRLISTTAYTNFNELKHIDSLVYNTQGKLVTQLFFENINNKIICTSKYIVSYDSIGNKISDYEYQGKNLKLTSWNIYIYNKKNQLIECKTKSGKTTYKYNDKGNIVKQVFYETLGSQIKWYYEYYYNDRGNMVNQVFYETLGSQITHKWDYEYY